jgi:hypothetical protein
VILTSGEGDGEGEKVEEIGGCTVMNWNLALRYFLIPCKEA